MLFRSMTAETAIITGGTGRFAGATGSFAAERIFFVATGITDGELLTGVRYRGGCVRTHSMVMRSRSGTIRIIESEHKLDKLKAYASIDFGSAN